jgi:tRNA nucleotidyltransferase/poly(A) polymerase
MPRLSATQQRDFAVRVVARLREAGYVAYWAGGCVRDQLLNTPPKDYDVATSALPDEIRALFGPRKTLAIGAAFGVITVLGKRSEGQIEVATFRQDFGYSDGRRPDRVSYSTPELDAHRRDFTINGLFYDPVDDRVIDYVGGVDDLRRRVVRAIGAPRHRFDEDRLRLLRAVRLAAGYGFEIEVETLHAIQEMAPKVTSVSAERIGAELGRMLGDASRAKAVELLRETHLLPVVLPELADLITGGPDASLAKERWDRTLRALSLLEAPSPAVALAALLVESQAARAGDEAPKPGDVANDVADRWRLPRRQGQDAAWLLAYLEPAAAAHELPWPRAQRMLIDPRAHDLVHLLRAVQGAAVPGGAAPGPAVEFCLAKLLLPESELNPPLLVSGDDLVARGLTPGKSFQGLLERVRDAQLEGRIASQEEALALVDSWTRSEP